MRRQAGFTLFELLIVLVILGAMLGLVVTHGPPRSQGLRTRAAAGALASALRSARATAIARANDVAVAIDAKRHRFAVDGGKAIPLDPEMEISVLPPALPAPDGVRLIRFSPDGSATGGAVVLGAGRARLRVDVEWLTGKVAVSNAP